MMNKDELKLGKKEEKNKCEGGGKWSVKQHALLRGLRPLRDAFPSPSPCEQKTTKATKGGLLFYLSGRQDSNLRLSGPKPDALTGLRYTPNLF